MLNINLEFIRGMLFVRLSGYLDSNTYTKLGDCLYDMIYDKKLKYFVLNLEELNTIDKRGFQEIIDRYFDITLHDGRLIICGYDNKIEEDNKKIFNQIEHTNNELNALRLINI